MPRLGQRMLYRPVPADFRATFIRIGWGGIEKHFHAHAKTISRWIDLVGREALIAERANYVREHGYVKQRRRARKGDQWEQSNRASCNGQSVRSMTDSQTP